MKLFRAPTLARGGLRFIAGVAVGDARQRTDARRLRFLELLSTNMYIGRESYINSHNRVLREFELSFGGFSS